MEQGVGQIVEKEMERKEKRGKEDVVQTFVNYIMQN